MKFYVVRTSGKTPPCEEAKHENVYLKRFDGKTIETDVWLIELNTLDELMELNKKYGDIIIEDYWYAEGKAIEIYDGYRE